MNIEFDPLFSNAASPFRVFVIEAHIVNHPTSDELWQEIEDARSFIAARYQIADLRHRPAIDATRAVYKALGKEPNRYRPSAEALSRRAVHGVEFYRSLAAIDLINLVSLLSGHSIGGFDADKIQGDTLTFGVGREGEPYEAIGRGQLNIRGLPVYRDAVGGIGTPTSDNDRTKLSPATTRLLMTLNIYGEGEMPTPQVIELFRRLLTTYASANSISIREFTV